MAEPNCIQSRAIAVALIVNSVVTLAAVSALVTHVARTDRACAVERVVETTVVAPPASPQWASTVRSFSSQYSATSWSAQQALGAPDVYPRSGDEAGAWASREADGTTEHIELGFAQPQRMRALEIYETFNPGAITEVELITEQGAHLVVPRHELVRTGGAARSTFGTTCTRERIAAVRITVASSNVAGWNEIDAVGMLPCP
jgi:hypothetical protein